MRVEREPMTRGERLTLREGGTPKTFADVLAGWRDDDAFRDTTIQALAASPFNAVFWEMPPLRVDAIDRPYECVLLESVALHRLPPDPVDFAEKFATTPDAVTVFPNLGGDATLIVPCPLARVPHTAYAHLLSFVRGAPRAQCHELLRRIGHVVPDKLSDRPLWLSTAGLGVPWLHVRLDSFPKYYRWDPYRVEL